MHLAKLLLYEMRWYFWDFCSVLYVNSHVPVDSNQKGIRFDIA